MTQNNINLDKICARYGIELLSLPDKLYEETNSIIKDSSNFDEFKKEKYDQSNCSEDLKDFLSFNLIDPLKNTQNRIKSGVDFNKIKNQDTPIKFDPKTYETEITKALGILVEDGPFAYLIWLKSQDKEPHKAMLIQTARILCELQLIKKIDPPERLKEKLEDVFINEITDELTKTLFVKTILEKMLIYGRYKAKTMQHQK